MKLFKVYPSAEDVEAEIRIWWARRHDTTSKRWNPSYVRKVIRSSVSRLRYLRTRSGALEEKGT